MRKEYVKPMMIGETFKPNEYCASCGESGKTYKFVCNAGQSGSLLGYKVYLNGADGEAGTNDDVYLSNYSPCSETHIAESTDDFLAGYMCKDYLITQGEAIPVIVWRGDNSDNTHCTTNLDIESWETAKS